MFRSYITTAVRSLLKNWKHALINIIGLALGIAGFILICFYVLSEWSFDSFHQNGDNLFRITTFESEEGVERHLAHAFHPLASALESSIPAGSQVVRFFPQSISVQDPLRDIIRQEDNVLFADSLFFEMFSFPLLAGDSEQILKGSQEIILTQSIAEVYFGRENPVGKSLIIEGGHEFIVSAVANDPPRNSSISFDFVVPITASTKLFGEYTGGLWYYPPVYTFVQIADQQFIDDWHNFQPIWKESHLPERIRDRYTFHFQAMDNIHFQALVSDLHSSVQPRFLWMLIFIALLILLMACINYINLSLSQLVTRFPTIGIRKVLGAAKHQIFFQLLLDVGIQVMMALFMAIGLVQLTLPAYNRITSTTLDLPDLMSNGFWIFYPALMIFLALLIVLLPYLSLMQLSIVQVISGKLNIKALNKSTISWKDGLIVFQFVCATALIFTTVIMDQQTSYLSSKDMGFDPHQVLAIPVRDEQVQNNYFAVKQELLRQPGVRNISTISNFPWQGDFYDFPTKISGHGMDQNINLPTLLVDRDFLQTMRIPIIEGENFLDDVGYNREPTFILNEAARKHLDLNDFSQYRISMQGVAQGEPREGKIVGIARNFHLRSLHNPIEPLVLAIAPERYYLDNIIVRVETTQLSATLESLAHTWRRIMPNRPFEYFFLDQAFDRLYNREAQMLLIFRVFTGLAIFIAFLGLWGLSSLSLKQRQKEIGIRIILGARLINIIRTLSRDILHLVMISLIIAIPIAWYIMNGWLDNFAYHTGIQWWVFLLTVAVPIITVFGTLCLHSIRASLSNPKESLHAE